MFHHRTLQAATARPGLGWLGGWHKLRRRISLQMHSAVKTGTAVSELGGGAAQTVKLLQSLPGPTVFVCPAVLQEFSEQQSRYHRQYIVKYTQILYYTLFYTWLMLSNLECSFHWTELDCFDVFTATPCDDGLTSRYLQCKTKSSIITFLLFDKAGLKNTKPVTTQHPLYLF